MTNLIPIYCILSWRIFWVKMLNRADPDAGPSEAFTDVEIAVLDRLSPKTAIPEFVPRTLSHYAIQRAKETRQTSIAPYSGRQLSSIQGIAGTVRSSLRDRSVIRS